MKKRKFIIKIEIKKYKCKILRVVGETNLYIFSNYNE